MRNDPGFRVVIFGSWTEDWNQALGPASEIWLDIPEVAEVIQISKLEFDSFLNESGPDLNDIFIPLMEEHIHALPNDRLSLRPTESALRTLANKASFARFIQQNGFSYLRSSALDLEGNLIFPLVIKQVNLNDGHGVLRVDSSDALAQLQAIPEWQNSNTVIEPYIDDDEEYVTHVVAVNGLIEWHRTFHYLITNGDVIRNHATKVDIEILDAPLGLIAQFEKIFVALNFSGPANIDYKLKDGQVHIMEINPRFGGSLMMPRFRPFLAECIRVLISHVN